MRSQKELNELKAWVRNWQLAGPELERIRRHEIRQANTPESIKAFDLAFKAALRNASPRTMSGLVELQSFFRKLSR